MHRHPCPSEVVELLRITPSWNMTQILLITTILCELSSVPVHTPCFDLFRVDTKLVIVEEQKAFWKVVLSGSPLLWQEVSCCLILLTLFPYSAFLFIRLVKDCTSRFNKIPRVHECGAVNHIISSILESYGGDGALSFIEWFGLIYKCGPNLILGWIDDNRSDIQAFTLICKITVILYIALCI